MSYDGAAGGRGGPGTGAAGSYSEPGNLISIPPPGRLASPYFYGYGVPRTMPRRPTGGVPRRTRAPVRVWAVYLSLPNIVIAWRVLRVRGPRVDYLRGVVFDRYEGGHWLASDAARNLKVISRWGVGYDAIDVPAATRNGIGSLRCCHRCTSRCCSAVASWPTSAKPSRPCGARSRQR